MDHDNALLAGQTSTRHEPGDDSIPWVFFLSPAFHCAVERREQPAPDAEVSSDYGRAGFYS